MPPFFIFFQSMIFFLIYLITNQWIFFLIPVSYQLVWLLWFGLEHNTVLHHARSYNRAGAIAWSLIYIFLEALFIARDLNILLRGYFFIMLAALDVAVTVAVMIMACNTMRDGGEFWSSNLLELCSVVWISAQVVRGVVLSSGLPILISIGFIRIVQDGVYKEAFLWTLAAILEAVLDDTSTLYVCILCIVSVAFVYVYRHMCVPLLLSPLLLVFVSVYYVWVRSTRGSIDVFEYVKTDVINCYEKYYGRFFPPLPKRRDRFTPPEFRAVSVW